MDDSRDYLVPLARLLLSTIFIFSGFNKLINYTGTVFYMEQQGVPGLFLPLVILTEIGAGLMVAVGYKARIAAFLLGGFSFLAGIIFHLIPATELVGAERNEQMAHFFKNIAIAGGFALIVARGAGKFAIDKRETEEAY